MSVIIGGINITQYIPQGGIRETIQKVYGNGSSASDPEALSKGVHYVYSISARTPASLKESLSEKLGLNSMSCAIDGISFRGEMTAFSAQVNIEYDSETLWDISLTVSDNALSDE